MLAELARAVPDADKLATIYEKKSAIMAAMATAYALAHSDAPATEIAARFAPGLRDHALRAALIQRAPMQPEAANVREAGVQSNQMVLINPGAGPFPSAFKMGSSEEEDSEAFDDEMPRREVRMTRAYAIGRFPVTQEEYLGFCRAAGLPNLEHSAQSREPVIQVSWHDTMEYCGWLNDITGEAYRLPAETEWEYACRAGTQTRYSWDDEWDASKAKSSETRPAGPSNVGDYQPNDWGLWDMHGNVYEWYADPWHDDYQGTPPNDQRPWLGEGDFLLRVLRGGSGSSHPQVLRSANRDGNNPTNRYNDIVGFRVARSASGG